MKAFSLGLAALLAVCAVPAHADGCGAPATPVHAIQGRADESPLAGSVRTVEAVVVASFQGEQGLNGFFVQEEDDDADDDPSTSEGLFIYAPRSRTVAPGDLVWVRGAVAEFHGLTELTRIRDLRRCRRVALPAAARPAPDGGLERVEGMLVEIGGPLVVTDNHDPGRRNQLLLASDHRQFQPTQQYLPGAAAIRHAAESRRRRLILDDGSTRRTAVDKRKRAQVRTGDRISMLRGVIDQFDDDYRLQPIDRPRVEAANPRPPAPARQTAEQLRVVAFNLRNYFNGDGSGGGFPTARGADSRAAFQLQRQKLVAALSQLSPDILGVMEVENDGFGADSAIADLAAALGEATGERYTAIDAGGRQLGHDAISIGLLYRPDRVRPVGPPAVLDGSVDSRFAKRNRPSLAQTFAANGERATIVVNHFKSKGSPCADQGDPDRGDGQGDCAGTRARAARALADWLETDPTRSRDPDVLILGDLNAYAQEDTLRTLADAGYIDLIRRYLGTKAYSYVFDGFAGYLDHALASPSMAGKVAHVSIWHINADEPPVLGYDGGVGASDPYRSSDHDPVIVDLNPGGARPLSAP